MKLTVQMIQSFSSKDDIVLATIMKEIQDHYVDRDLRKISERLGYNYNYFSNLIRKAEQLNTDK